MLIVAFIFCIKRLTKKVWEFSFSDFGNELSISSVGYLEKMSLISAYFLAQCYEVLKFLNNWSCLVSISFENYRMVHPFEDSDSSDDEVDWQDTRHDPYRLGESVLFCFCFYVFNLFYHLPNIAVCLRQGQSLTWVR